MKKLDLNKLRLILAFSLIGLVAILLCIAPTRDFLVGVFGYAIFAYLVAVLVATIFMACGKEIIVSKKRELIYFSLFACFLITIHIATNKSALLDGGYEKYLWGPFSENKTAGGVLVSLLTFYCVPMGYVASLVIFYVLTAALGLMAIWPLLVYSDKQDKKKWIKDKENSSPIQDEEEHLKDDHQPLLVRSYDSESSLSDEFFEEESVVERIPTSQEILFNNATPVEKTVEKTSTDPELIPEVLKRDYSELEKSFWLQSRNDVVDGGSFFNSNYGNMPVYTGFEDISQKNEPEDNKTEDKSSIDYMYAEPSKLSGIDKSSVSIDTDAGIYGYEEPEEIIEESEPVREQIISRPVEETVVSHYQAVEEPSYDRYSSQAEEEPVDVVVPNFFANDVPKTVEFIRREQPPIESRVREEAPIAPIKPVEKPIVSKPAQVEIKQEVKPEPAPEEKKVYKPYVYTPPPITMLAEPVGSNNEVENFTEMKQRIDGVMNAFKIDAEVVSAVKGPTVTRYELKIGDQVKISRIESIKDNITMRLQVESLRILAPIKGKDAVGIEIPNKTRRMVGLREIVGGQKFIMDKGKLTFALGSTVDNQPFFYDLTKTPHLLVAGTTNSGKSCGINSMLISWLYKYSPEDLRLILIDPKRVELLSYCDLPHMLIPNTITEVDKAINAIKWLVEEMDRRYAFLEEKRAQNIDIYNNVIRNKDTEPKLPRIVLVIDEMADLMLHAKNSIEKNIARIAGVGRACGIHLVVATQRPSADVITGLIKSNIPSCIAFTVKSITESMIIMGMGESGAETLLSKGDSLFMAPELSDKVRIQGAYVDGMEIAAITQFVKDHNKSDFDSSIESTILTPPVEETVEEISDGGDDGVGKNSKLEADALKVLKSFIIQQKASISLIQSQHNMGYIRAKKIMDMFNSWGVISPQEENSSKSRKVLISMEEFNERFADKLTDED